MCNGSTAGSKKPAPDVYLATLAALGLPATDCIAIEDSENGLRAACAAGIPTVVTPTAYTRSHPFGAALVQLPHLGDPDQPITVPGAGERWVDLAALHRWHRSTLTEVA